ncbi:Unknown protein [Striga hermonthica]|uniref:Uncharacterized protein n=1 Tax=Striga hermonthica TaxID=68872 RepID=A0A9N7RC45_STRHE|nr:Unknown protein [Striga hermonthica]
MRREGRPHGMVRTCPAPLDPLPKSRILNQLADPPTAGPFTKVPSRPTNHSKPTSKRNCDADRHFRSRSTSKWAESTRLKADDYSDDGDEEEDFDNE